MRVKALTACLVLCLAFLIVLSPAPAEETTGTPQEEIASFFNAFVTVPANSLPGDLPYLLRLIAQEEPPQTSVPSLSPLAEAAAKYAELIKTEGVHYAETTNAMGMNMKAEYWMKGKKFKLLDQTSKEISVFDGEWFYKYPAKGKTGVRMAPDNPEASAAIQAVSNYTLSMVVNAPYQQQEDQKIKGFDCLVFYMDIDMMGMKGNWLYIDKETGALVKNRYGEEKGGMSVTVTKLEVGKFGDEVFEIPTKVKITGP